MRTRLGFLTCLLMLSSALSLPALKADDSPELKQWVADLKGSESVKKRKAVKQACARSMRH